MVDGGRAVAATRYDPAIGEQKADHDEDGFDPAGIEVFVGVDMATGDHYAQAITAGGDELFDRTGPQRGGRDQRAGR